MLPESDKLREELLALSREQRAEFAVFLLESLEVEAEYDQHEVERQWADVAQQRIAEIDSGQVQCRPFQDVINKVRARYL